MLQRPDLRVIQALTALEGNVEFQVVLAWLQGNLDSIRKDNDLAKDEVLNRWNQGACQALDELIDTAKNARQAASRRK
jgi:hypothetical protein